MGENGGAGVHDRHELLDAATAFAAMIRRDSHVGELTSLANILASFKLPEATARRALALVGVLPDYESDPLAPDSRLDTATRQTFEDLRALSSNTLYFYSTRGMKAAGSAQVAVPPQVSLADAIAKKVRDDSSRRPQLTPANAFALPPFRLDSRAISEALAQMKADHAYQDIQIVHTSSGEAYLYSTDYLTPAWAKSLADWLDSGHSDGP